MKSKDPFEKKKRNAAGNDNEHFYKNTDDENSWTKFWWPKDIYSACPNKDCCWPRNSINVHQSEFISFRCIH